MELILGAGVSVLAQLLKKWTGTKEYATLAVVLGLSLIAALAYQMLIYTGYWEATYRILITAGGFYAFVMRRFDENK